MTDPGERKPFYTSGPYRLISGGFGLFIACVGVFVLLGGGTSALLRWIGGVVLLSAGVNMAYSALRATESWLSKLGPTP